MMVVGLLGYFVVFPDTKTHGTQGEGAPVQTAAKAVRYEAVTANWNRYRNKDARADARERLDVRYGLIEQQATDRFDAAATASHYNDLAAGRRNRRQRSNVRAVRHDKQV